MDYSDIEILKLLQKNARITVSEISSKVNISISAVSERVKKLESSGIIEQYTAITNAKLLGKNLTAMMFVSLERPRFTDRFVEFVKGEEEILECYYLAGDYDYSLKILTESTDTLEMLLNRIKSVQGVQKTKTIVTLSTVKKNYSAIPEINEEKDRTGRGQS